MPLPPVWVATDVWSQLGELLFDGVHPGRGGDAAVFVYWSSL